MKMYLQWFKTNLSRWVFFMPIFILALIFGRALCLILLHILVTLAFPIDSISDFMALFVYLPAILFVPLCFFSILCVCINICPNRKIGAFITFLLLIILILTIHIYYTPNYTELETIFHVALDAVELLSSIFMFIIVPNSPPMQQEPSALDK